MISEIELLPQVERAPSVPVNIERVRRNRYGRWLEEFEPGAVFHHPRGLTIFPTFCQEFATTFMQANPLFLNHSFARAHGFEQMLVSPLMALNLALSLGVQNDSEQAIAHLGYYHVVFPRPVYPGDTLRSQTTVIDRRRRGPGRPGVVRLHTEAVNQRDEVVVAYDRAILVPPGGNDDGTGPALSSAQPASSPAPVRLHLPGVVIAPLPLLTGRRTYFEDFTENEILLHANGRTVTDEHMPWTYRLGNTHPLHYDRLYSAGRAGALSGEPVVYGGLVFAWIEGLASRDTSENALWDLGYTEGYHTQPVASGDTLYALSRVLAKEDGPAGLGAGIVTLQLIGLKNLTPEEALERFGTPLFDKEINKSREARLAEKVFEIERRLLIKKRANWPVRPPA